MTRTTLIRGDARRLPLADKSVHMCVTSPPYYGLRDYGTARWEGGDEACDHRVRTAETIAKSLASSTMHFGHANTGHAAEGYSGQCRRCGARRVDSQIGLEATPAEFVATMVRVFREVWRVLRDDGTCWINLGDSYSDVSRNHERRDKDASGVERPAGEKSCERCGKNFFGGLGRRFCSSFCGGLDNSKRSERPGGLKHKDLCGIPWRTALALQADGWYLRSDIIWSKNNPMPESVTDRPTKSHEYLFLLSKNEHYYYDADAVREEQCAPTGGRQRAALRGTFDYAGAAHKTQESVGNGPRNGGVYSSPINPAGRNLRSVWSIPTEAYPGAHFATFPRRLVEPAVKAGTSEKGCCPRCGAGWLRVVERESWTDRPMSRPMGSRGNQPSLCCSIGQPQQGGRNVSTITTGWRPGCGCFGHFEEIDDEPDNFYAKPRRVYVPDGPQPDPVPAVILDPFVGSGTTLVVANALGRNAIGCDLSPEYLRLARHRIERPHARTPRPERDEYHPLFDEAEVTG